MSNCCSSSSCETNTLLTKGICPANGKEYAKVSSTTIKHHIAQPWNWDDKGQAYYFCDDPECNVVYFGEDSAVIHQSELRTKVGVKRRSMNRLICYCFGIDMEQAINNPDTKDYVVKATRDKTCACETRNPAGKCCLKDFPKS